jgi:hypothetical protein
VRLIDPSAQILKPYHAPSFITTPDLFLIDFLFLLLTARGLGFPAQICYSHHPVFTFYTPSA